MIYLIIALTVLISVICFGNSRLFNRLTYSPFNVKYNKEGYRFLSYALVHADFVHLLVNMFVLYSFGSAVEYYYTGLFGLKGYLYFALLYLGGVVLSVTPAYGKHKDNPSYSAVGASGAVSAVVFASIIFNPLAPIGILFIPFNVPSIIFGSLYLVYSAYMTGKAVDNVGHDAHFWGAVFGIFFTIAIKPSLAIHFYQTIADALSNVLGSV
jgi:membrane associated rhomboid family serine protease